MIPIIIAVSGVVLITIITAIVSEDEDDTVAAFLAASVVFILLYLVSQTAGMIMNTHDIHQQNITPIVSLQDGSQIQGQFSGNLFVMQGTINQVEYFSYYHSLGNGAYALDKQLTSLSDIVPDATPDSAYLYSTSTLTHCVKQWWSTWCSADSGIYNHGDFHVPPGSITNNFVLDAK